MSRSKEAQTRSLGSYQIGDARLTPNFCMYRCKAGQPGSLGSYQVGGRWRGPTAGAARHLPGVRLAAAAGEIDFA